MRRRRSGFTMIEIMVVIAIMSLMIVLAVTVMGGALDTAKLRATQATIQKIDGVLAERQQAFDRLFEGPNVRYFTTEGFQLEQELKRAGITVDESTRRILLKKNVLRDQGLPQTFNEAFREAYWEAMISLPAPPSPDSPDSLAESSEILYWIVSGYEMPGLPPVFYTAAQSKRSQKRLSTYAFAQPFGLPSVDASHFSTSEVGDTDSDGRLEFIDAWGRPLQLYRWPTRVIRPAISTTDLTAVSVAPQRKIAGVLWTGLPAGPVDPTDPDDLRIDPDDPQGRLALTGQFFIPGDVASVNAWERQYHTPLTYHAHLIVSSGPDLRLGMFEPGDRARFGNVAQPQFVETAPGVFELDDSVTDNVTNRNNNR